MPQRYQIISIPGEGDVEFPVDMSDQEIADAITRQLNPQPPGQRSDALGEMDQTRDLGRFDPSQHAQTSEPVEPPPSTPGIDAYMNRSDRTPGEPPPGDPRIHPEPVAGLVNEVGRTVARTWMRGSGALSKGVAGAARNVDRLFGREKPLEDYATHRWGQTAQDFADERFGPPPGAKGGFLRETLPAAATSAGLFLAGGAGARALKGSALAAAALMGSGLTGGQLYEQALKEGVSEEEAMRAWLLGSGLGLTEAAPIGRALGRFDKFSGGKLKNLLLEGFKGGLEEAVQELVGTAGQLKIEQEVVKGGLEEAQGTGQYFTGAGESMAAGGVVGTGMNVLLAALGLLPSLLACHRCGASSQSGPLFPARVHPGLCCRTHAPRGARAVGADALAWLDRISQTAGKQWPGLPPAPPAVAPLLGRWVAAAIEKQPRWRAAAFA